MRKVSTLFATILLGLVAVLGYAQAPVPFINQPLVPDATAPGGPQFTLTVNGTGFVSNSTVNWNGSALSTTFISASQLTAAVPAADIATASTGWVTVVNPVPDGASNTAFFTVTPNVGYDLTFTGFSSPAVGGSPASIAAGDFNGDGKLDLAVANECGNDESCTSGSVSILLGDGTGNFTLASSPAVGKYATSVAVGDFNRDGKLDLAVANDGTSTVSILLGDGTGNFTLASSPATGDFPSSVAVGDFNGDGKLDLAAVNEDSFTVSILLGDGTGNFTLAASPSTGAHPESVAVGDFNGDGKLDLAVANYGSNTVSILLGDGTGNFTLASSPATGRWPYSVAVGDFNGDGKLDLAVANQGSDTVSVLLGDGTGNFVLASSPAAGYGPNSIAVGDFNGDGTLDLATSNTWGYTGSVLLGDGAGSFTLASSPNTNRYNSSVAAGDFNGDGKLDLAFAYDFDGVLGNSWLSVWLQTPAYPIVTLSPTSLNFGTQLFGTSSTQTLTLTNSGTATLDITSIAASANFSQTNTCGSSLAAGTSCTIYVTFQPRGVGAFTGTVTITDNASNSPQTVPLTGTGTFVELLPASIRFGEQPVGTRSAPRTLTLVNRGLRPLSIAGIRINGADAADFAQTNTCGSSVPVGASCTFSVTFTPKATGSRTATLGVADNGGASPQTVALFGDGT